MNKKSIPIAIMFILILLCIVVHSLNGKNVKKDDNKPLFSGKGQMSGVHRVNGLGAIYDDEYIYFNGEDEVTYKLSRSDIETNKKISINTICRDASCSHDNEKCEAFLKFGEFFVFNRKTYKAYNTESTSSGEVLYEGHIVEIESGKEVFDNPIPKDMPKEYAVDDSKMVTYVRTLGDGYLKVEGQRHAYILDENFNIVYCYYDVGKFPWGAIFYNTYYYVNDAYQMVRVNLDTKEVTKMNVCGKVFMADNDKENIYFTNEVGELYKMDLEEETVKKLVDDALFFSVQEKYIYASAGDTSPKSIYDKNGKFVSEYTSFDKMGTDNIFQIEDKVFTIVSDGIVYMDIDGKNYIELVR